MESAARAPETGLPIVDNLLALAFLVFAALNFALAPGVFADIMIGIGAGATAVLTLLRIYEHLIGEPISETLFGIEQEA